MNKELVVVNLSKIMIPETRKMYADLNRDVEYVLNKVKLEYTIRMNICLDVE